MLVTEQGMLTDVSPEHPLNAQFPMLVTESGMLIDVSPLQPQNALSLMLVTELGMVVFLQPVIKVFVAVSMMALQLLRES